MEKENAVSKVINFFVKRNILKALFSKPYPKGTKFNKIVFLFSFTINSNLLVNIVYKRAICSRRILFCSAIHAVKKRKKGKTTAAALS